MAVLLDFFTIGNRVVGYSLLEGSNPLLSAKNPVIAMVTGFSFALHQLASTCIKW